MHTELNATCNDGSNLTKLCKTFPTYNIDCGILTTLVISRGGQSYNEQDEAKKIVYLVIILTLAPCDVNGSIID